MGMMVRLLANLRKVRMKRVCLFTLVAFCFAAYQVQAQIKWDAAKFMPLSNFGVKTPTLVRGCRHRLLGKVKTVSLAVVRPIVLFNRIADCCVEASSPLLNSTSAFA